MVYVIYDSETGIVDNVAHHSIDTVPTGKPNLQISNEMWKSAQGKIKTVINGEFIISDPPITVKDYEKTMENHLKTEKIARGYIDHDPSEFFNSGIQKLEQDAIDWIVHRNSVMTYGIGIISTFIDTGEGPTITQFASSLPTITWTYQGNM